MAFLRKPAGDQTFITTTPGGAFNFLFGICITAGLVGSIPVIVYQLLRYVQPLIKQGFMRVMAWGSIASGVLAIIGIVFAYYCGLPSSLKFLFGQSSNLHIEALITIDSYTSFVTMYLFGAALLFQLPLILLIVNRIKPLKPMQLLKFERPFIVVSAILGALISPSPNVGDMMVLTIPMIIMYQVSMILIWIINHRHRRPKKVVALLKKDAELQAERLAKFRAAQENWQRALQNARTGAAVKAPAPVPHVAASVVAPKPTVVKPLAHPGATHAAAQQPLRRPVRRPYFNDFSRRPYTQLGQNQPRIEIKSA